MSVLKKEALSFIRWLVFVAFTAATPLQLLAEVPSEKVSALGADARKEIVKFTGAALVPEMLQIAKRSCSVFFVNTAEREAVHLEMEYGKKRIHCHSKNLKFTDDGVVRSTDPIAPRDFAILCFPEEGEYSYTVRGLDTNKSYSGRIEIRQGTN